MKKIITAVILIAVLSVFAMLNVSAASASVTGNSTLKAGDTLTLNLKFNASEMYGFEGKVQYDATKLEYQTATFSNAAVTFNYNDATKKFTAFAGSVISPNETVKMTFKVKASLTPGTSVSVKFYDLITVVSLEFKEEYPAAVTYTKSIAAPPSADATLSTLKITNANGGAAIALTPTFSKNVTSYTVTVPFAVSKINVSATTTDAKAKATYTTSYTLKENSTTTITVNVKAENGATKAYTVKVTRPSDPNYKPSTNADLASLTVTGHSISPAFSKNTTSYSLSLPNGVSSIKVTAKAADAKATVKVTGGTNLVVGNNTITVTCTAEDGKTKKIYTITAKREASAETSGNDTLPVPPVTDTTLVDELTGVSCFIPAGKAPADVEFTIQELTSGDAYDVCVSSTNGAFKLYTPALMSAGAEIQPNGTIKMTFPTLDGIDSESAHVYSYADGTLTEIPFTSVDGHVVVETHNITPLAIFASAIDEPETETTAEETQAPETNEETDGVTAPESETQGSENEKESSNGVSVPVCVVIAVAALLVGFAGGIFTGAALKSKKEEKDA